MEREDGDSISLNSLTERNKRNLGLLFLGLLCLLFLGGIFPQLLSAESSNLLAKAAVFKSMFISILLEALPFLLLGIFVSSIMQVFIPEAWIQKIIPKNPLAGVIVASLLGIVFPVCECGLIPVVRRLMAKGMPLYAGVSFILAGPIVNLVVISATITAFRGRSEIVYSRVGLALLVSSVIGLLIYYMVKRDPRKQGSLKQAASTHSHSPEAGSNKTKVVHQILRHSTDEFFDMGKYLILGAVITALIQTYVPRTELIAIGQGQYASHLFMLGFAYILSLCSTSDAFVASSFMSTFSASSLLTFLVFGPMIDFKGTLMLLSVFRVKFVILLIFAVAAAVVGGALLFEALGLV